MSIDRLPPQSVEAEQSVLGAMLIDKDAVTEVAEILKPDDFYRGHHGTIYAAALELYEAREPVDIITISEVLERQGKLDEIGGSAYLTSLMNLTPTAVNVVHYARIKWRIKRPRCQSALDTEPILAQIAAWYEDGLTLKQIGARLGVHGSTVRCCMVRHNMPRRPRWASGQHLEAR